MGVLQGDKGRSRDHYIAVYLCHYLFCRLSQYLRGFRETVGSGCNDLALTRKVDGGLIVEQMPDAARLLTPAFAFPRYETFYPRNVRAPSAALPTPRKTNGNQLYGFRR